LSDETVLEYRLTARYGSTTVLDDVEGRIACGEIVALVGLSGSGKSTLALALQGLLRYRDGSASGSVQLEGREISGLGERDMRRIRGKRMGYVPQSPAAALNPKLRIRSLIDETWRAHASGSMKPDAIASLLETVHLPAEAGFLDRRAGELSTGQGQRLLIALAILHQPALVIADEPTSALDVITQAAVLRLLADLNRRLGTAILFISHDLLAVAGLAHRVDILHRGRLVESGPPATILHSPEHSFTRELVAAMPALPNVATQT
jgi:ABC-type glutathione transport system ATPase component